MDFYKTIRGISAISILTVMPYICDGCNYSGSKRAEAKDTIERAVETSEKTLEIILEK